MGRSPGSSLGSKADCLHLCFLLGLPYPTSSRLQPGGTALGSSGCQASGSYGPFHMPASCLRCTPFPLPLSGLLTPSRRPSLSLQTTAVSGLSARCPCHGLLHFLPLPLPISSLLRPQNHNAWNIFSTKVLMKRPGAALGAAGWAGFPFSALCPGPSSGIRTVQYIIKVSVHQARTMDVTSTEELTVPLPPFYR